MPKDITIIEPADPRHRQIIRAALRAKDTDSLSALRGNTDKPIWLVHGVFLYFLMRSSWNDTSGHVAIFLPQSRPGLLRFCYPDRQFTAAELAPSIPTDTYDAFLH